MNPQTAMNRTDRTAAAHLSWIAAAATLGFASAYLFADLLALPRAWFLVPHVTVTAAFLAAYARWAGPDLGALWTRRLTAGVAGAAVLGAMLVANVVGQPASARAEGLALVGELLWVGVVYGATDALLLSVMPVVAALAAAGALGWTARWPGRIAAAALALAASVLVTTTYHLGFAECRGAAMAKPIIGNTSMTVAQLVTGSPVAATGAHVAMHVAAVLHGPDSTVQLPPHRAGVTAR